ncbi:MAG: hypothetical protein ACOCX1_04805 [Fimbriimonadaceae bacterium]
MGALNDALRKLGSVKPAEKGLDMPSAANTHVHLPPNFSAFETVRQATEEAQDAGLAVLGASNYYDFEVYGSFIDEALERGVYPLLGIEILTKMNGEEESGRRVNDPVNPGKAYLCGKGITQLDPVSEAAAAILEEIRETDERRMVEMIAKLNALFSAAGIETHLHSRSIKYQVAEQSKVASEQVHLQERHVAQAFQRKLFEKVEPEDRPAALTAISGVPTESLPEDEEAFQAELRNRLMKARRSAFVPEGYLPFSKAVKLIEELGGIVCYPVLADGAEPTTEFETPAATLARRLNELGITAAEFIPTRNQTQTLRSYVEEMVNAGLTVSAGTEHNTGTETDMVPKARSGEMLREVEQAFWRGACTYVGHQHRGLNGGPGADLSDLGSRVLAGVTGGR